MSPLTLGISMRRFQIWNLRFVIRNPEGHAFVLEGLHLDRRFIANNPGYSGKIASTTSCKLCPTSLSSVSACTTATRQANRGATPVLINVPA